MCRMQRASKFGSFGSTASMMLFRQRSRWPVNIMASKGNTPMPGLASESFLCLLSGRL